MSRFGTETHTNLASNRGMARLDGNDVCNRLCKGARAHEKHLPCSLPNRLRESEEELWTFSFLREQHITAPLHEETELY